MKLCLAAFILSGCSSEEPEMKDESCRIVILLDTSTSSLSSGAESHDTRSIGDFTTRSVVSENDVKNLTLYVVTDDNRSFPVVSRYLGQQNGNSRYEATLSVAEDYVTYNPTDKSYYLSGRIAAVANMPVDPVHHPFSEDTFPVSQITSLGLIPMWGITTVEDLKLRVGDRIDCGTTIEMLRAVPKFTLTLADDIREEFKITGVVPSTKDFNLTAFCQPGAAETAKETGLLSKAEWYNPASADNKKGDGVTVTDLNTDCVRVYTGERSFDSTNPRSTYLNVTIERRDGTGAPIKGKVYMCDYKNGSPDFNSAFDRIVRNHDYQYSISLASLEMIVSFRQWIYGGKVHIDLE
ncbi:MAG: hypothetical protein K2L89_04915 [Muribaculaceae bacterium]|nr:hypothetical protein [Muribaculaceae bacterium]